MTELRLQQKTTWGKSMPRGVWGCEQSFTKTVIGKGGRESKKNAKWQGQCKMSKLVVTSRDRPGEAQENAVVKAFTVVPFKRRDELLKCSIGQ